MVFINPPGVYEAAYQMVRPFIDPKTASKVRAKHVLPPHFAQGCRRPVSGGTRVTPQPQPYRRPPLATRVWRR